MQISSAHCSTYITAGQTPMKTPKWGGFFLLVRSEAVGGQQQE
jgi:hypothetical protein